MPFRNRFGIPLRTAGTRCLLGRLRSDEGTITPGDATPKEQYVEVTGFSARDAKHVVTGEYDAELDETTVSYVRAYASYPALLNESDPQAAALVLKLRGPIGEDEEGKPTFPAVTITARPLATQLDYQYTGPAHNPLTGGLSTLYTFQGDPSAPYLSNAFAAAQAFEEYGSTKLLAETNYWRSEDVPEGHTPPWAAPTSAEYDFDTAPRAPVDSSYDWQKWETWDMRYRFPSWYATELGDINELTDDPSVGQSTLYYTSETNSQPSEANPFAGVWIAPVVPGWYIEGGGDSIPPVVVGPYATVDEFRQGLTAAVQTLTSIPELTFAEEIRKLYAFSFGVAATNDSTYYTGSNLFSIHDNEPSTLFGEIYYAPFFNNSNVFKAYATWALEITAEDCCWLRGYKLRGKVRFKQYAFDLTSEGAIGTAVPWVFNPTDFPGGATSLGNINSTIWQGMRFRLQQDGEGNLLPPTEAGELDWEVTIDETTATGAPFQFGSFFVAETTMVDGEPVVNLPLDALVYVSDFEITEIVPPAP